MKAAPFTKDELGRITALADLALDYSNLKDTFKDLVTLAAKVTGSPIAMVNIIDNYTVWTVCSYGFDVEQTPREESICQYTILENEQFAINDLKVSPLFKDELFVTGDPNFRFYHGVPLKYQDFNLGALCVLDHREKEISAEKVEMMKIISREVINRLKAIHHIEELRNSVHEAKDVRNRVAHDIRGPIAGIISLADIINQQGAENNLDEVLEFIKLIYKSGRSVLDLADEILSEEKKNTANTSSGTEALEKMKARFLQLYTPQALSKSVAMNVIVQPSDLALNLPQPKLMQIAGNLISNAIKFTPKDGNVTVTLSLQDVSEKDPIFRLVVADTGTGITSDRIAELLADNSESTNGTEGENGFGFGLTLVKHLVKGLKGTFDILSGQGVGSKFIVNIPYKV